jgi:ethanolaminephosphotransferase
VGYILVLIYAPHLTEAVPRWVVILDAVLIFLYQTLDNIDGKQARRTGSSSPLGELFDHGCDALTLGLIGIITAAATRIGSVRAFAALIVGWGPFYLAHWEEYHSGILIMGKFNGPTEAQLIVIALLLFTGIVGPWVWVYPLFTLKETVIYLNDFVFAFTIIFSLITVGQNIHKVLSLPSRTMPLTPTILQLTPFAILAVSSVIWGGTEHELLTAYPHVVLMSISFVFAYVTSRLIVNRVCKEPTQLFHLILIPTMFVAFVGIINEIRDSHTGALVLAYIFLTIAGLQFVLFSICIIQQLTTHLGIRAFKIVPVDPSRKAPPTPHQGVDSPLLEPNHLEIQVDDGAHSIE